MRVEFSLLKTATIGPVNPNRTAYSAAASGEGRALDALSEELARKKTALDKAGRDASRSEAAAGRVQSLLQSLQRSGFAVEKSLWPASLTAETLPQLQSALAGLDEAARATSLETISQLWTIPSYLFYMVGVERLIAFALQICLSYLVYRAVRYHRRGFFLAAMGIHFAVDALAALLKDAVPIPALEAILAVIVIVTAVFTVRLYRAEAGNAVSN